MPRIAVAPTLLAAAHVAPPSVDLFTCPVLAPVNPELIWVNQSA
jgi:hypothetical protein